MHRPPSHTSVRSSELSRDEPGSRYINIEGYWIIEGEIGGHEERSEVDQSCDSKYILTPSVRDNLRDLARVVAAR
ncbi:unnamed protein product [Protopolystoma xenopodis]|uniref:Uncharacterized protein n=1 Tax=Protopolystoma xenopodis TaxID=117903 RepID=A0A3S5FF49_9PLAT|nr:unnamed protein product [Protopolystoma xenopodis]VEL29525.1 unnamed protein product [Protopolystoma xenopodis]